ncbi:MAG: dihydroneopterin aldolase, partial [Bacteroidota bacterium]|nr:dihydroneopterin aldolase [Bacteroidota bacterium]
GNRFNIDIRIKVDIEKAGESDKLKDALDYVEIYQTIKEEMQKKCNLVENVSARVKSSIFEKFPQALGITLKITKLSPKIGGMVDEMSIITDEA